MARYLKQLNILDLFFINYRFKYTTRLHFFFFRNYYLTVSVYRDNTYTVSVKTKPKSVRAGVTDSHVHRALDMSGAGELQ